MSARSRNDPWTFRSGNVVDEIYDAQEMRQQIKTFFRRSPLWRSLEKTLIGDDRDLLIDPPYDWAEERGDLRIACHRGTGYGVRCLDAAIYGPRGESSFVKLKIEVDWETSYEEFSREYTLRIPIQLCREFDQDVYQNWMLSQKQLHDKLEADKDVIFLERMIERYGKLESIKILLACARQRAQMIPTSFPTDAELREQYLEQIEAEKQEIIDPDADEFSAGLL
jgi:hypothetical protein